jgi:YesN/AraC family two-component response regulator
LHVLPGATAAETNTMADFHASGVEPVDDATVRFSPTTHDHVRRMLDVIHQRYNQRLTLAGLSRILRRQAAYLGRLFYDEIGVTVHEYITRARMVFGAVQIRAGVKIEAVSLDLGYRSKKSFYRQFRRHFGMTPEAYRHGQHTHLVKEANQ